MRINLELISILICHCHIFAFWNRSFQKKKETQQKVLIHDMQFYSYFALILFMAENLKLNWLSEMCEKKATNKQSSNYRDTIDDQKWHKSNHIQSIEDSQLN